MLNMRELRKFESEKVWYLDMCRNPKYTCTYSSRWTYRAAECVSWIMYEGHRTHLLLDAVIRRGTKRLLCLQRSSFSVWRISASYMADIITSRIIQSTEDDPANICFWMDDCDCESKPLPVFLQPFGLLACLRVLIHQVKPFVLLSFHL